MEKEKDFTNEGIGIPQAWNSVFGIGIQESEVNCNTQQFRNSFFNPNCVKPIVSSPANSHPGIQLPGAGAGGESIVLRELIGRLGSICNSGEISAINGNNSSSNSCYNTPLNSPQKLNMSITDHQIQLNSPIPGNHQLPLATFSADPGFADRAARFSTFITESCKTAGSQFVRIPEQHKKFKKPSTELGDSMGEVESSVSETETGMKVQKTNSNGRKRKGKETQSSTAIYAKDDKIVTEVQKDESDAKKSKSNEKSTEPPKDYIHVRARRGQATDSHSLAERVRREKISERMKFLQGLVPGCNKVTGKAVMLDEIINYVQSLQRQVEFLSMKLASVNPKIDASMEALLSKDIFGPQVSMPNNVNPYNTSLESFPHEFRSQINGMIPDEHGNQFSMNHLMAGMNRNSVTKSSHIDGFNEASMLWENDLQSVVKMALGEDHPQCVFGQMKVEL